MKNKKLKIGLVIAAVIILFAMFLQQQKPSATSVFDQETINPKIIKNIDHFDQNVQGKDAANRIYDQEAINPKIIKNSK